MNKNNNNIISKPNIENKTSVIMVYLVLYNTDILTVATQVIIQQCNCVTTSNGKGLYLSIIQKFPHAHIYNDSTVTRKPGRIIIRGSRSKGERYVIAFLSQYYPGAPREATDSREQRLKWFKTCLERVGSIDNLKSVAFPYGIGCGLAKGRWEDYEKAIIKWSKSVNIKVTIVCKEKAPIK